VISKVKQSFLPCFVSALFAAGCVVSFDDYPVGSVDDSKSSSSGSGSIGGASGGISGNGGSAGLASGGGHQAGTAGLGGEGSAGAPAVEIDLIDDFEDGDDVISANDGRVGTWYASNDGSGTQEPSEGDLVEPALLAPARDASQRALHTFGGGFTTWGAFVRANLRVGAAGANQPYDASDYTGVRFWARSGDDEQHAAFLVLPSADTTMCPGCGDHFGTEFEYSSEWQEYHLPFDEMEQRGFGAPRPALVTSEILAVQILFEDDVDFDIWIDDVGFY
jgi:hypothetical protein